MSGRELFRRLATGASGAVGSPWAFLAAVIVCLVWAASGPYFHYSDTWQLVINTGTTVLTFLIVFLIQYSQNRDAKAIQLKLDELLRGVKGARTGLVDLEQRSDQDLQKLKEEFEHIREEQGEAIEAVEEIVGEVEERPDEHPWRHRARTGKAKRQPYAAIRHDGSIWPACWRGRALLLCRWFSTLVMQNSAAAIRELGCVPTGTRSGRLDGDD